MYEKISGMLTVEVQLRRLCSCFFPVAFALVERRLCRVNVRRLGDFPGFQGHSKTMRVP